MWIQLQQWEVDGALKSQQNSSTIHPGAVQLFILHAGKTEAQYYTSLKKEFEFLNAAFEAL